MNKSIKSENGFMDLMSPILDEISPYDAAYPIELLSNGLKLKLAQAENVVENVYKAVAKTSPPVVVSGLTVAGVQLQDWLIIATLLYTVIQIIIALPKLKQSFSEWRKK